MALDENELAFYTNEELVQELMKRETFLGMVVYADSPESISDDDIQADFKLYGKGFSPQQAQSLLSNIVDQIDPDESEEDWK
tara:strand:+ start:4219 stop:4464 length:246 start_codon:yes stop_codon:yes gene_type:complete